MIIIIQVLVKTLRWHIEILFWVVFSSEKNWLVATWRFDQYALIAFRRRLPFSWMKTSFSFLNCHRKHYYSIDCYMVSPQTVFTYPFHHAKLQILLHGVTANSLYLSFSPCKATNLTTWCHRKQSLLILFTMQSYKFYYMVSQQTVFTYPFHHAKLQVLLIIYKQTNIW